MDQLLEAQAHVWNHMFNFVNSMSLKCAVELGIPDIIHNQGKPMILPELVSELRIKPEKTKHVYQLMRLLVQSGFFAKRGEGYVLTDACRLLLKDDSMSMRPFLLTVLDPESTKLWHYMSAWFQKDDPTAVHTARERLLWDYHPVHDSDQLRNNIFNEAMANDSSLVASVLTKEGKGVFAGLNSLLDVGGGTGTMAKAIANAFPSINCTVLDLPQVVAGLQGTKNLNYLAGDMFKAIPAADAILLKWIMHDWGDEECVKILKRCREAIPSKEEGGKVMIIDMIVTKDKGDRSKPRETQLLFDIGLMVLFSGKESEEKEWEKLFMDVGFSHYKITPMFGLRSLIEVYR